MESDFTLMTSSDFDNIVAVRTNHVETSFFLALSPLVDAFQNEVRFFRFLYCDHLEFEAITFGNESWERFFADLAFKLGEVV